MRKNEFARSLASYVRMFLLFSTVLFPASLYLTVRPANAQVAVGTSAGEFLGFEVGASSAGIAGANTSVATGATSQFWNPSLLSLMSRPQVSLMHATWLGNLQYEWIGYARPLGPNKGVGSLSVAYFHMPSLSGVDQFDNPTGDFRVYDMAMTAGYARPIWKTLMLGVNGKFIRQMLADVSGTGVAVDFGASAAVMGTTIGATVQNLGPDISFGSGSYPLPQLTRFGVSHALLTDRLLVAADYTIPKTYYNDFRIGTEFRAHPMLAVRAGYRRIGATKDDPATGFSFGLGTHVGPMSLDYAMTPSNGFADVHRFSLGYTFGGTDVKPEPEPRHPKQRPVKPAPKTPPAIATITDTQAQGASPAPRATPPAQKSAAQQPAVEAAKKEAPSAASTQVANSAPAPAAPSVSPPPAAAPAPETVPAPKAPEKEYYEVVLGNYQTEQSAQSELKALQILGFAVKDAVITVVPGKGYRLSLARYDSRKPADQFAAALIKMSFTPRVEVTSR
ncbi:MAG TPA: PorV/PorQ family protein [Candidatus Dormibacteraeota bacterium]|nr:PorV/PorQ family protein [Candidatus Dormibacteraeota bacterium]